MPRRQPSARALPTTRQFRPRDPSLVLQPKACHQCLARLQRARHQGTVPTLWRLATLWTAGRRPTLTEICWGALAASRLWRLQIITTLSRCNITKTVLWIVMEPWLFNLGTDRAYFKISQYKKSFGVAACYIGCLCYQTAERRAAGRQT